MALRSSAWRRLRAPVGLVVFFLAAFASGEGGAARPPAVTAGVSHALTVSIDAATRRLAVSDAVQIRTAARIGAEGPGGSRTVDFLLNGALEVTGSTPEAVEVPLHADGRFPSPAGPDACLAGARPPKRYRVRLAADDTRLQVSYEGVMDFGLSPEKEQYTRGFRQTAGTIGPEGVYLAGSSCWYPSFGQDLVTFSADIRQPEGWHTVAEGSGTSRDAGGRARWASEDPLEEIHLVGGPLHVFRDRAGGVETLVYLHEPDQALAARYLGATGQYLEMYRQLIGPYPYDKFALVENFWETGYGMPSFTLLGPEVIRFPFILTSSYPHEILHNWWGNSVFVDYGSGNWSEGLTAYLADHLLQEQRGAGAEYRRATLQKYRDYVREGRDFPLAEFRGRESASTEAVGYGKALMAFHMLRLAVGDDTFRRALERFYRDFKGTRAAFADIQATFEAVSGRHLRRFFSDWVGRAGAPVLAIDAVQVRPPAQTRPGAYAVQGTLRQAQGGEPFALDVPVLVETAGGLERQVVRIEGAAQAFSIETRQEPLRLLVDPEFDVFRKLDPRETPASIGQIFGEPRALALLPASAPEPERRAWRALFEGWTSESHAIDIRTDREVTELPADRAVWIAGRTNRFAGPLLARQPGLALGETGIDLDGQALPLSGHTLVVITRHPRNVEKAAGWLSADPIEAFPGLGRKLPHYGRYSYLAFEGTEPANVARGQWTARDSPLAVHLTVRPHEIGASSTLPPAGPSAAPPAPGRRKPLVDLPPVFSREAMAGHLAFLADPARGGRMPGTGGHDEAARYIAERFKSFGLLPGGDDGDYFQPFQLTARPPHPSGGGEVTAANVIGYIPGTRPDWKGQAVVVSAHYDHLGTGWPDVHKGDEGQVHPGADDNASGVAVMLDLGRALAAAGRPSRSIVFIAFSGEEAGRLGSRHYVDHAGLFPPSRTIGVINLDTVGRLGSRPLSILGTGTATEWPHIFRGASFVTGVESLSIPGAIESSDQASFTAKGVPAVQLFT
ncbi:MAG TPA: M20/M25/M40 family metallo-hydrolase, partial [Vicinamibacterales bacterium]|nr:M20/M25/M40 family metallo-hydrolase [Vicinamibacterales bacterium]